MDLLPGWISTEEAADMTGYTTDYICKLARRGRIRADKFGRDWLIERESLLEHKRKMDALGNAKHDPTRGEAGES